VGASNMVLCCGAWPESEVDIEASISSPIASPIWFSRASSNAAPRAIATGNAVE